MFSQKKLAAVHQQEVIHQFKLSNKNHLSIAAISKVPGFVYSSKPDQFSKEEQVIEGLGALHFIKRNDKAAGMVWHASGDLLQKAVRFGIGRVEAPTAKAIAALGQYRQKVLTRAYEKGIISDKHQQKEALVTFAQDSLTALQGLERLVNSLTLTNSPESLQKEKQKINRVFEDTVRELRQLRQNAAQSLACLEDFDRDVVENVQHLYDEQIRAVQAFSALVEQAQVEDLRYLLKATGVDSVLTMVKTMSLSVLVKLQELNQNMTYSRRAGSFLRGDLNNACEDALKVLRDFEVDLHNPILPAHQGRFAVGQETVAMDFSDLGHQEKRIRQTLQVLVEIAGQGITPNEKSDGYLLKGEPLLATRFTKWKTNTSALFMVTRPLAALTNIVVGTVAGVLIDLPFGFLANLCTLGRYKMPSLAAKWKIDLHAGGPKSTLVDNLATHFSFKRYSLGALVGQKIADLIRNTVLDIAQGVRQSVQNWKFKGFDELQSDFKTGSWGVNHETQYASIFENARVQLASLVKAKTDVEQLNLNLAQKILQRAESSGDVRPAVGALLTTQSLKHAILPYHLSAGEWNDLSNASVNGLISVTETFVHNIHTKHPFVGLVFSASYAAGGFAILAPGLFSFLTKPYLAFSQTLGNLIAQGAQSSAIASGFTQAKLYAAGMEGLMHGGDSWLAEGVRQFEENPANTLIYAGLAVGLGYTIANEFNIPGLSEYIQDDTGSIPVFGWAFAGAKLGILLVDLLEPKHQSNQLTTNNMLDELKKELATLLPTATAQKIEALIAGLLSNNALTAQARILKQQAQLQIKQLELMQLLGENRALLSMLDNKTKRDLMLMAGHLFKDMADCGAFLRGIKEALYPQWGQSIFTRTLTIMTDYLPLLVRCVLSPLSLSLEPWRDLGDKLLKDVTRVAHGLAKSVNAFLRTMLRLGVRGIADVVSNEVVARVDGLVNKDKHRVSAQTYQVTKVYEESSELMRQLCAVGVDTMRQEVTAPDLATVLHKTQAQACANLDSVGFFGSFKATIDEGKLLEPNQSIRVSTSNLEETADITC